MPKPRILETTTVADVEELLSSRGPDAVVVRDMVDPQPFSDLRASGSPDGSLKYDRLLVDQVPALGTVVTAAEVWIAQRMPGLKVEPGGFYHDARVDDTSLCHVDSPLTKRQADTSRYSYRGPLSVSVGIGNVAMFKARRVRTYAVPPNREGLYRMRRPSLELSCTLRTIAGYKIEKHFEFASIQQRPGDGVFLPGLPWQTYHTVLPKKGRSAELFDMHIGNDPHYWDKK